jgi:hypothetical protein
MSSGVIRDPLADHLITPQNAAMVVIDYRPLPVAHVACCRGSARWPQIGRAQARRSTTPPRSRDHDSRAN